MQLEKEKPKFVRFTNDGLDHTSGGVEIPYYVSPFNKFKDWLFGHQWRDIKEYQPNSDEIRCDRCWKLRD